MKSCPLLLSFIFFCLSLSAQVGGSGTGNHVPLWAGSTTLGNSVITQSTGKIGVSTSTPLATLHVTGASSTSGNAIPGLKVVGGRGGNLALGVFGTAGSGGSVQLTSGIGGNAGIAPGGPGATILMTGGTGGNCFAASTRCAFVAGNGGSIMLQPGTSGSSNGHSGNIILASTGGRVGVGNAHPLATLDVGSGNTTLADSWVTRSSRRFKTNIQPILGALGIIQHLQGVSYDSKHSGNPEIGMIAEDVQRVLPQVVSRESGSNEVEGIDYSRLTAVLVEALKSQQTQIEELQRQIHQLQLQSATH